jgi:tetratricopeptide (TPR) repeat protein
MNKFAYYHLTQKERPNMKLILASTLTLMIAAGSAFAAGDAPATKPTAPSMSPTQMKCAAGQVVKTIKIKGKKTVKKCAKAMAGVMSDDELYAQGRLLAKQGEYDWALTVLAAVADKNNPNVLNYMGYSNRKAGQLDIALTYYNKALAIDPNFNLAREYLGEGYVAAGRVDLAMNQLQEIGKRGGVDSGEYKALAKVIAAA